MNRRHAREAAADKRWHWYWRRLHSLISCKRVARPGQWGSTEEWSIDVGYCLDRYTIEDAK